MRGSLDKNDWKRILIVRLSAIGDVVMTTPVAKALRNAFPDAYIAWVVEDRSKDVIEGNPYLDEIVVWRRSTGPGSAFNRAAAYLAGVRDLRRELRARKFDVAIDFQGLLRSALVARISGAKCRVGYDSARERAELLYNVRLPMRDSGLRGPEMYRRMLELLGIADDGFEMHVPIDDEDRAFARRFIAEAVSGRPGSARVVALCPATTWRHKHWTEDGWARVADDLVSRHGAVPIFLGSKGDAELMSRIRGLLKCDAQSAIGKTTLKQASAILEQSDLVISVDTGLLHIANALSRPIVGIFGPTTWQYLRKKDTLTIVAKDLPCMPCFRHPSCSGFECMQAITAEDVLSAAAARLAGKVPAT
jgi:heptosyltransferase-1